jgi:hypothetical protein
MQSTNVYSKITLVVLLFLASATTYGKAEYLPGYIINPNGDTLKGYIEYRNWSVNPDKIFFKKQLNNEGVTYTVDEINGFTVSGEIYVKAIVTIDESKTSAKELDFTSEVIPVKDTVFLQALILGTKSLYWYKNKSIKDQFYIWQDTVFELLIHKKYLTEPDSTRTYYSTSYIAVAPAKLILHPIAENNRYLNQLALYLKDCQDIQLTFKNTDYSKRSLEQLFQRYYECTLSKTTYQVKTENAKAVAGALAGLSITSVTFSGVNTNYLVNTEFQPSVNFAGGLFLNLFFPRNFDKFSLNNELFFTTYKAEGSYTDYENENVYTIYTTSIGLTYLKLNSMLRYYQPVGNVFIFINAGGSMGIGLSETNYRKRENVLYNDVTIYESKAISDIRQREFSYNVGFGAQYKKYLLEFRYERGNGMSYYASFKAVTERLYFLLGYTF